MITFIPSWSAVSAGEVSMDDMVGPIQAFRENEEPYCVVISDYLPNLRYFLHRFDLLESNYVSLFDRLQGFDKQSQQRLSLSDLNFPDNVSYVYSPFFIMVYSKGEVVGRVRMKESAHISEVSHFVQGQLKEVEIYDDRGFLSSWQHFENGVHVSTDYLDSFGVCVFTQEQSTGRCVVNLSNPKGLQYPYFESIDALAFELLEAYLSSVATDHLFISVHEKNRPLLCHSRFLSRSTLSYFDQRVNVSAHTRSLDEVLVLKSRGVVVNSDPMFTSLLSLPASVNKIHKVSPFDSRFTLSISHELREEVLYFDVRKLTLEESQSLFEVVLSFIYEKFIEGGQRRFKLTVRTDYSKEEPLVSYYQKLLRQYFPEEEALLEQIALDEGEGQSLEAELEEKAREKLHFVRSLKEYSEIVFLESDDNLFKVLHEARLIVDVSLVPDLFTQIAGISAGLPQINRASTEYIIEDQNGRIIEDVSDLKNVLSYYLDSLKYWQKARVYSVEQMRLYSGGALCERLLTIFREEI